MWSAHKSAFVSPGSRQALVQGRLDQGLQPVEHRTWEVELDLAVCKMKSLFWIGLLGRLETW